MIDVDVINNFIDEHKSNYKGKYRFHSCFQNGDHSYKIRYYMYDETFRQIDIYIDVSITETVDYHFSADLYDQEQLSIIVQFLKRLKRHLNAKSYLHYSLYSQTLHTFNSQVTVLEPLDYIHLLNFMKYHRGYNVQTMDEFYKFYIPCMELLIENRSYKQVIESIKMLLDVIVWEYEWEGYTKKYIDTEYHYHLYYIRRLMQLVYDHIDDFVKHAPIELYYCITKICEYERFAFAVMTNLGELIFDKPKLTILLFERLLKDYKLVKVGADNTNANLVVSMLYYIHINDYERYYETMIEVLRKVVVNCLSYANANLDYAIAEYILNREGYEIIFDLFSRDYNTFIFDVFPLESFSEEYQERIVEEMFKAIQFFSARMEDERFRLSSFEQCKNINRILLEYYKEDLF